MFYKRTNIWKISYRFIFSSHYSPWIIFYKDLAFLALLAEKGLIAELAQVDANV